ncbi:trypsin-like peptidase domain-containing protein [Streptomyces sp. NPDC096205]|uniref:S1C family serine protease n=1 Tax=Streptomyces sp. NPDC096205 TaxID=3366081 RepID=UPI003811F111
MNEGRPTQDPSGQRTEAEDDFHLERPSGTATSDDGDFELRRPGEDAAPLGSAVGGAAPVEGAGLLAAAAEEGSAAQEGPAALEGPAVQEALPAYEGLAAQDGPAAPEGPAVQGATAAQDVPASLHVHQEPPAAPAAPSAHHEPPAGQQHPAAPAAPSVHQEPPAGQQHAAPASPPAAQQGPPVHQEPPTPRQPPTPVGAQQMKPLHDPDPYSTPPYGEPGPWAPAPPVQHPATTPAHGTAVPAPAQPPMAHGGELPPAVALPQGTETAAPAVSHGTEMPAPAVSHGTETATPPPPPGTELPGLVPGTPATPAAQDGAATTPPAAAPAGAVPTPPPGAVPTPPPGPSIPGAPADPWARYDPWATAPAGPLQQTGQAAPSVAQRRRRARKALVLGAVLLALVSGGVGGAVGAYLERNGGIGGVELPQAGKEPAGRDPDSVAGIAARALPSVVTLHVSGSEQSGTGTGFVLDDQGHILTNNHVVEPAGEDGEITVTFHSGDTAEAELVGGDTGYDLAVVRVKGVSGLQPAPLGNSDNVQVGDPVVAIGAPFDLAGTVTSGIISAKQRPITAGGESGDGGDISYVDALQTDAPINPGNSGGPLLDSRGRVIGINSAIRSAGGGSEAEGEQAGSIGLGFAIPVNQGKRVAEELINTGRATHPVIGITLDMDYSGDGARVGTEKSGGRAPVTAGGPGDRAGIEAGDVITEVDGQRVHSGEELIVKTRAHRPGDRLELTVERGGKERTVSLVLGSSDDG